MADKKDVSTVPLALHSPPSHPAMVGEVWIGVTRPSPDFIAEMLKADASRDASKKTWNG